MFKIALYSTGAVFFKYYISLITRLFASDKDKPISSKSESKIVELVETNAVKVKEVEVDHFHNDF